MPFTHEGNEPGICLGKTERLLGKVSMVFMRITSAIEDEAHSHFKNKCIIVKTSVVECVASGTPNELKSLCKYSHRIFLPLVWSPSFPSENKIIQYVTTRCYTKLCSNQHIYLPFRLHFSDPLWTEIRAVQYRSFNFSLTSPS